jgi:hypothetical protein
MCTMPFDVCELSPGKGDRPKIEGSRKNRKIGDQRTERSCCSVGAGRMLMGLFAMLMMWAGRSDSERCIVVRAGTGEDCQAALIETRHVTGRSEQAQRKQQPENERGKSSRRSRSCSYCGHARPLIGWADQGKRLLSQATKRQPSLVRHREFRGGFRTQGLRWHLRRERCARGFFGGTEKHSRPRQSTGKNALTIISWLASQYS